MCGSGPDFFKGLELQPALKEWGSRTGYVFYSRRIGLPEGKDDMFADKQLRAVIANTLVGTDFKMKEELFSGLKLSVEEKKISARDILGYVPSSVK